MSDPTRAEAAAYRSASPGTLVDLHRAIKARMASIAAGYPRFETKTEPRAPLVFEFQLPPKKSPVDQAASNLNEQYPFLVVQPRTGVDSEQKADQSATATFDIVIGTYSDADDGCLDALMLVDAIRLSLGAAPVLAGTAFEHTGPLTWEVAVGQPRPEWLARVTTNWTLPRPRRVEALNPTED